MLASASLAGKLLPFAMRFASSLNMISMGTMKGYSSLPCEKGFVVSFGEFESHLLTRRDIECVREMAGRSDFSKGLGCVFVDEQTCSCRVRALDCV